jgi:hypothetical protein
MAIQQKNIQNFQIQNSSFLGINYTMGIGGAITQACFYNQSENIDTKINVFKEIYQKHINIIDTYIPAQFHISLKRFYEEYNLTSIDNAYLILNKISGIK